jgi:hypothetical protein
MKRNEKKKKRTKKKRKRKKKKKERRKKNPNNNKFDFLIHSRKRPSYLSDVNLFRRGFEESQITDRVTDTGARPSAHNLLCGLVRLQISDETRDKKMRK